MKPYPAIALIELSNIAAGIYVGDAMLKKAPVALLKSGTVSRGKYLVLVGGTVAAVDEAYHEGMRVARGDCLDSLLLPDVHQRVFTAVMGEAVAVRAESLGILETESIASNIEAADAAIKGALVDILQMRLGDGYGGKGYTLFNGALEEVQAAIDIACERLNRKEIPARVQIIANLTEGIVEQLNGSLRFREAKIVYPPGGEQDVTG